MIDSIKGSINTAQIDCFFSSDFSISLISAWAVEQKCFCQRILCSFRNSITLLCKIFSMILSTLTSNKMALINSLETAEKHS